jgi:hypothetical protein
LPLFTYLAAHPLGLAELSCGNYEAAHELLASFEAEVSASGVAEPALVPFLPDAVEALVRLGKLEAAAGLLAPFEAKSVELGRGWGIAALRARPDAARGRRSSSPCSPQEPCRRLASRGIGDL